MKQLKEKGIETRPGFTTSSLLNIYEPHSLPVCEDLSRQVLSLPTYTSLCEEEISYVCEVLLGIKR
jgi:dTDP-4-amino-4,6-dideoxygalactose transaminase